MIKFKLHNQHRPFWGWVERHFIAFVVCDILGGAILIWVYSHFNDLVRWVNHH